MLFRRIRWRIALPYAALIIVSMAALAFYATGHARAAYIRDLETQLTAEARLAADGLSAAVLADDRGEIAAIVARYGKLSGARVTVVDPEGNVLADTDANVAEMNNHLYRPEIQQALSNGAGSSIRRSATVSYDMLYVAVLLQDGDRVAAIVRLSLPLAQIEEDLSQLQHRIAEMTLITLAAALLLALFIAERTARPVRQLIDGMQRVEQGDLNVHVLPSTRDEIGALTRSFNAMVVRLREAVNMLGQERGQLAAVLEHMADGVLIADGDGIVRLINPAALRLLNIATQAQAINRSLTQVVGQYEIVAVWQSCRQEHEEREDVVEAAPRGPLLRVIVTPLGVAEEGACLMIMQDFSQIRRLDTVRREFVSNISHELRTPLASMRAVADTLRDGALEDPEAASRFLSRMDAEIDAMTQMVQELLELSRIESGQVPIRLVPMALASAVTPAVERLSPQIERGDLTLSVDLPENLPAVLGDVERLQQVITNIVHNAIKFTPPGGRIAITGEQHGDEVVVSVRDNGVGIPADVLPRIFERFYKADRARSGGGTGLGLAIAKHIVQAHGGRIWAESEEGRGSAFSFSLIAVNKSLTNR